MIGPLKLIASCTALLLVSVLLVSLSTGWATAGADQDAPAGVEAPGSLPAPYEWVMVLIFFSLVIALYHCRRSHRQRS